MNRQSLAVGRLLDRSRLVLTTLASIAVSQLPRGHRFDVVVMEEASMAALPSVF